VKLEYLSSAVLPLPTAQTTPVQTQPVAQAGEAKVHVTSLPSGSEIYVDGKFYGNTPSDLTLAAGEHSFKITIAGKEWSRIVQITTGEIALHAEIAEK
jgi:PEGA domain